jgi:ATP-dependent DNA helicase 2 subunit 1
LTQAGVTVEPFFISTEEKSFDVSTFYSVNRILDYDGRLHGLNLYLFSQQSILLPTNLGDEDELQEDSSVLPESISISRIEDLLSQMRFHEVPKRSLFSIPFKLANGFTIGIKGLVNCLTEYFQ